MNLSCIYHKNGRPAWILLSKTERPLQFIYIRVLIRTTTTVLIGGDVN